MIATSKSVFTGKNAEITYDDANNIIIAKWTGFLKLEELKQACTALIDFTRKSNSSKHLSDQSQLKVLSKEVQEQLVNNIFPELEKAGLRKLAVLVSDDVFAKATVDNVNRNTAVKVGNITFNTFNARQDCINWLNA